MQPNAAGYLSYLEGSQRTAVVVDAWRGGRCVAEDLRIVDGQVAVTAGQAIRSNLQLAIADRTGVLVPTAEGALSGFGSQIRVRAGIDRLNRRTLFSLGWFCINDPESEREYRTYRVGSEDVRVLSAAQITLTGQDRAQIVQNDKLLTISAPTKPTVFQELARLCSGVVAWKAPSFADVALTPGKVAYTADRLEACQALADLAGAEFVFNPDGAATLIKKAPAASPAWVLPRTTGGRGGVITEFPESQPTTDVFNAVAVTTTAFDGTQVVGWAYDTTPGLAWGGPFGRKPKVIESPMAGTREAAEAQAKSELAAMQRQRWVTLPIKCVPNFALEVGDVVRVPAAKGSIDGQVTAITWPLTGGEMTMSVAVDPFVLERVV